MRARVLVLVLASGLWPALAQEGPAPAPGARPVRAVLNALTLNDCRFKVEANDDFASVVVEQRFFNPGAGLREADFLFPLPEGAMPGGLELMMSGRFDGGNLLTRSRARRIYDSITRRSRDPALLECIGKQLYRCRVFPVPAHDEAAVRFAYRQPLLSDGAMRRLIVPLDATRFNSAPARDFALTIHIRTKRGLQSILCPTHAVRVRRVSAHEAFVDLQAHNAYLAHDLELLYAVENAPLGAVVSSYRPRGERGYFVLSLDAAFAREQQEAAPRDVVLAIDTSNSAGRNGIDRAAAAAADALAGLRDADRVAWMAFSTGIESLTGFRPVSQTTPDSVRELFARHPAAGRTRLAAAIRGAAEMAATGRPGTGIVVLTDGIETEADGDPAQLARQVAQNGHRIGFCGVGDTIDAARLDEIGAQGLGDAAYAVRGRGLAAGVRRLFDTTRSVPLTDVEVRIDGVRDLYPRRLEMLDAGDPLLVAGRYARSGVAEVRISAKVAGQPVEKRVVVELRRRGGDPAVARLWAARRIGVLLDEARRSGEPGMHRAEIVRLGRKFGIVTPHTALLVLEQADQQRFLKSMRRRPLLSSDGGSLVDRRARTREAVSDAELAERIRRLRRCDNGAVDPFVDLLGANRLNVRRVNARTYYRSADGTWVQDDLVDREPAKSRVVEFLSDEWRALLESGAEVRSVLALGRAVLFTLEDGEAVRIVERS